MGGFKEDERDYELLNRRMTVRKKKPSKYGIPLYALTIQVVRYVTFFLYVNTLKCYRSRASCLEGSVHGAAQHLYTIHDRSYFVAYENNISCYLFIFFFYEIKKRKRSQYENMYQLHAMILAFSLMFFYRLFYSCS